MLEQIKQLRVEIDGLAQLCEGLKPIKDAVAIHYALGYLCMMTSHYMTEEELKKRYEDYKKKYDEIDRASSTNTTEIKEAVKSLKLSKAWLGKVLERLGSENPYGSGYKTVEDIEPTADKATEIIIKQNLYNSLISEGEIKQSWNEKSHIEKVDWLRTEIKQLIEKLVITQIENKAYHNTVYQYLSEARFWLGFEMGRIRDESKK